MAIVNLGTFNLDIGQGPYISNTFAYNQRDAYAIYAEFTSTNFGNIFSFARIYPYVFPTGGVARLIAPYLDLEIIDLPQLFYFPCSKLFDGNGDAFFYIERRSFYTGGGDGEPVNLTLTYDDAVDVRTWL